MKLRYKNSTNNRQTIIDKLGECEKFNFYSINEKVFILTTLLYLGFCVIKQSLLEGYGW